jgi:hypothetical protein
MGLVEWALSAAFCVIVIQTLGGQWLITELRSDLGRERQRSEDLHWLNRSQEVEIERLRGLLNGTRDMEGEA